MNDSSAAAHLDHFLNLCCHCRAGKPGWSGSAWAAASSSLPQMNANSAAAHLDHFLNLCCHCRAGKPGWSGWISLGGCVFFTAQMHAHSAAIHLNRSLKLCCACRAGKPEWSGSAWAAASSSQLWRRLRRRLQSSRLPHVFHSMGSTAWKPGWSGAAWAAASTLLWKRLRRHLQPSRPHRCSAAWTSSSEGVCSQVGCLRSSAAWILRLKTAFAAKQAARLTACDFPQRGIDVVCTA